MRLSQRDGRRRTHDWKQTQEQRWSRKTELCLLLRDQTSDVNSPYELIKQACDTTSPSPTPGPESTTVKRGEIQLEAVNDCHTLSISQNIKHGGEKESV